MLNLSGESKIAGAVGNVGAMNNLLAGSPSFTIGPRNPFKGMPREQLEDLKKFDDRPQDLEDYYRRLNAPGPQPFPLAGIPGSNHFPEAVGNMAGLANAGMFYGPQYGQALQGFAGKTLS